MLNPGFEPSPEDIEAAPNAKELKPIEAVQEKEQPPVEMGTYPPAVRYIISNEFCERFNYYGMRTILVLYLTQKLNFNEETATVLFHTFTMFVYVFPLIGALIADGWLGKYKTILYLSLIYSVGTLIVAIGATPYAYIPPQLATLVGLLFIALGTGGIKPCVSAFGGDQFILPQQALELGKFFSLFYFAINAGSMISTTVTPILRADVHCFGEEDCFPLAFGLPAVLMLASVYILVSGKHLYRFYPPAGNMIFGVSRCVIDAFKNWRKNHRQLRLPHFLDYATPSVGQKMVHETKCLAKILRLYLPFPLFWALFDQQGSRWTFQATRMNGDVLGLNIKPDQMQVVNPLLILGFIPLFDYAMYPMLKVIGIHRPLQKLTLGGLLAATAFLISGCVEMRIESLAREGMPNSETTAHLRLYNGMPCRYEFSSAVGNPSNGAARIIEPLGVWTDLNLHVTKPEMFEFEAKSLDSEPKESEGGKMNEAERTENFDCPIIKGEIRLRPGRSTSYFLANDRLYELDDGTNATQAQNLNINSPPLIRTLLNTKRTLGPIQLRGAGNKLDSVPLDQNTFTALHPFSAGAGELDINGKPAAKFELQNGGLYSLLVHGDEDDGYNYKIVEVVTPNALSILWQLPQIIVMTCAEVMFSVTGLEFSFTQAPPNMKAVLQACWLLSVAVGNMIVVIMAEVRLVHLQSSEFMLFGCIMLVDMLLFIYLASGYVYLEGNLHDPADVPTDLVGESRAIRHKRRAFEKFDRQEYKSNRPRDFADQARADKEIAMQRRKEDEELRRQREQANIEEQEANDAQAKEEENKKPRQSLILPPKAYKTPKPPLNVHHTRQPPGDHDRARGGRADREEDDRPTDGVDATTSDNNTDYPASDST